MAGSIPRDVGSSPDEAGRWGSPIVGLSCGYSRDPEIPEKPAPVGHGPECASQCAGPPVVTHLTDPSGASLKD
jgi:hypothetical protein